DLTGVSLEEIAPALDRVDFLSPRESSSSPVGYGTFLKARDGREIPVILLVTGEELEGKEIRVVRVFELSRSSLEPKREEAEVVRKLTEENELLRFLIDEVPSPLVIKNYEAKFVLTNKAVAELYGASDTASMVGKDDGDYIDNQEMADFFRQNVRQIMDEGETRTVFEDSIDVKTGERRHFQSIKRPFVNKHGEKQILLIATDITEIRHSQEDLEEQKNLFRQVIDELPSPFIVKDYDGKFVLANKALAKLYNVKDPDSMIGKDDRDYIDNPNHADSFKHNVRAIMDKGVTQVVYEDSFDVKSGERRHYMSIKRPFINPKGEKQILVIANDITEIQRARNTLMQYQKIMSVSHDFLSYEDRDYKYQAVNDTYLTAFSLNREEIIGKSPRDLFGEEFFEEVLKPQYDKALQGGEAHFETWIEFPLLGKCFVDMSYHPYISEETSEIEGVVTKIDDITERYEAHENLRHLADHDILTGLPNRRKFGERLTRALFRSKRHDSQVAVFFIDLDRFKVINDSLGHSVGDMVLQEISNRLSRRIRTSDTLARSGGDEFLLLLEDFKSIKDVTVVCESFLEELTKPILLEGNELFVTASIGVALYPSDASDEKGLIQSADTAMYQAKKMGRNTYQLSNEELRIKVTERFHLEKNLRSALEKREFELFYQPQVQMDTGKIVGAEVLLRWARGKQGYISPASFIPVAEECGVMIPLGEWVLKSACRQMAQWLEEGLPLASISVNISGSQLLQANFTEMVKRCLAAGGLEADYLELEITESYLMNDTKQAAEQLEELRGMGVSVAIDDFGTDYSSLRYLQQLPISKLKIDRSFVRDIPGDKGDSAIVKTMIDLAKNLEISVLAEGVEDVSQESFLLKGGCRIAQGFKYGKPMGKGDFEKLLK
ncbi:MAG: EAL domain-containing protein, partial [Spirochaetales bacterium]|nr:EAL domain-containing protein [Spirochaetales bacterium]